MGRGGVAVVQGSVRASFDSKHTYRHLWELGCVEMCVCGSCGERGMLRVVWGCLNIATRCLNIATRSTMIYQCMHLLSTDLLSTDI